MKAIELLSELFHPEHASPLEWEKSPGVTYASGTVPIKGHDVSIDITFADMDQGVVNIEFMVGGSFELTGSGGASQVFATVIEAVREFVLKNRKVKTITFTAEEKSRARMYDTITKRVAHKLGWHVVPYDEVMSDPKYATLRSYGSFSFAIEKGGAPAHRQAAQKPQHGGFDAVFYVYGYEQHDGPAIKIKAKKASEAENWVIKNVPELAKEHPMSIFAIKTPPAGRKIIDMGSVPPAKPKAAPRELNPIEKALHDKLSEGAVEDLEKDLKNPYSYNAIDHMMQTIARKNNITPKQLHDLFVKKHNEIPDKWVKKLQENFADGKNPGRKGLAKRSGVNCKASVSTLRNVAKNSSGEKQRMAHWCANMKSGRNK